MKLFWSFLQKIWTDHFVRYSEDLSNTESTLHMASFFKGSARLLTHKKWLFYYSDGLRLNGWMIGRN